MREDRDPLGDPGGGACGVAVPAPQHLPAPALGSRELLWLERTLVLFYGFLLLVVPVLRVQAGEVPIELSTRGARYADLSEHALSALEERVAQTEELLDQTHKLVDGLATNVEGDEVAS
jgi:hypothetical protein